MQDHEELYSQAGRVEVATSPHTSPKQVYILENYEGGDSDN